MRQIRQLFAPLEFKNKSVWKISGALFLQDAFLVTTHLKHNVDLEIRQHKTFLLFFFRFIGI